MPLVYLPESEVFFLWGADVAALCPALPSLMRLRASSTASTAKIANIVTPEGLRRTSGDTLALAESGATFAMIPSTEVAALPASMASMVTWVLASKLAISLVTRERVVPTVVRRGTRVEARWAGCLSPTTSVLSPRIATNQSRAVCIALFRQCAESHYAERGRTRAGSARRGNANP